MKGIYATGSYAGCRVPNRRPSTRRAVDDAAHCRTCSRPRASRKQLGGLTGWVASVIESLGEVGVGLLVALENLIPPIPSEIVLSMAGYLASEGRVNVVLVTIAATAGSVLGALALYWLGYALGEDRLQRWLDRIPLVDADDLNMADRWFERHAKGAVLFGRMAPVVRSLVSIPAGANHMPLGPVHAAHHDRQRRVEHPVRRRRLRARLAVAAARSSTAATSTTRSWRSSWSRSPGGSIKKVRKRTRSASRPAAERASFRSMRTG